MKSSIKVVLLCLVVLASFSFSHAALVNNGDFQTTSFEHWIISGPPNNLPTIESEDSNYYASIASGQSISQTITTTPNQSYALEFDLKNFGASTSGSFSIISSGVTLISFDFKQILPSLDWQSFSIPFESLSGPTTITFSGLWGVTAIDNIAVVPVPAAALLLGTGLIGLVVIRRRTTG